VFSPLVHSQIQRVDTVGDIDLQGLQGQVVDSAKRLGIPYAHVFLVRGRDTIKLAADVDGRFSYPGTLTDTIQLLVSAVGYEVLNDSYLPLQHGPRVKILMRFKTFSLDALEVVSRRSRRKDTLKVVGFNFFYSQDIIEDRDTMFKGIFPVSFDFGQFVMDNYLNDFLHFEWYYTIKELEKFLRETRWELDTGIANRARAAREHMSFLEKLPDEEFAEAAAARGISPGKYRKEQIRSYEKMIAHFDRVNDQARLNKAIAEAQGRLYELKRLERRMFELFGEAKYKIKRYVASQTVDGHLYNYFAGCFFFIRGLCPVARRNEYNELELRWGFINEQAKEVIPCRYGWVSNVPHSWKAIRASKWHYKDFLYPDPLGWITVGDFKNHNLMGMVDREGKERIPLRFIRSGDRHQQIEFFTPRGSLDDFAPVTVWQDGRLLDGIIDRSGNFTLEPTSPSPILWDKKRRCFYTRGDTTRYFDACGQDIQENLERDR